MALLQFTLDDTSPAIAYSPFPDTLGSPNLTAGWNPYFTNSAFATSLAQLGNGTSLHITSLDGAALAVRWFGTGIQLYGNITHDANYSISIDGIQTPVNTTTSSVSDGLLFSQFDLPQSDHLLSMTVDIGPVPGQPMNTSMLVFDYAFIQSSWENNTQPTNQTLPDILIDFHGNWTNGTDSSSRASQLQGDTAHIQFLGQAFFLAGTTSPSAGNYSVTLDNSSSPIYSAKSSFTVPNALLFYATGLQENMTHDVLVRNEGGGTLEVANGGWSVFADGSPLPSAVSPPSSSAPAIVSASTSFPKGTIAAFALAGILAFLLLSGISSSSSSTARTGSRNNSSAPWADSPAQVGEEGEGGKEREVLSPHDGVMDIRPQSQDQPPREEGLVPVRGPQQTRDSGKSGFVRWKREMQDLRIGNGIMFRHSDCAGDNQNPNAAGAAVQRESTTASSKSKTSSSSKFSITSSFRVRKALTAKGKQRALSQSTRRSQNQKRSWSPSYALDLPLKDTISPVDKDKDELVASEDTHESGIATLSYISTPSSPKPPMYTLAGLSAGLRSKASRKKMAGNASPPSGPRTVSGSTVSAGATVGHDRGTYEPVSPTIPRQTIQLKPIRRQDRGSVLPEEEARESARSAVLGPATARAALRGLSPRTSRAISASLGGDGGQRPRTAEAAYPPLGRISHHAYAAQEENVTQRPQSAVSQSALIQGRKPRGPRGLPVPPIQTSNFETIAAGKNKPDAPVTALQPTSKVTSPDEVVEVNNGVFLSVRELSPFRIDFPDQPGSRPVSGVIGENRRTSGSYRDLFDPSTADIGEARRASGGNLLATAANPQQSDFVQGSSAVFRLTPLTALQPPIIDSASPSPPQSSSGGVTSFLDLTASSDASLRSRSVYGTADSAERERAWEMLKAEAREKSRWSATTAPSLAANHRAREEGGSNASQASSTFPIPFQVSIPPSPYPRQERYSTTSYGADNLHVHPAMSSLEDPSSPTESIPFSISDLNFRHSDSESQDPREASDSQFPTHPPLPGSEASTPLSSPNFIVQRVLGMTPPASSRPTHSQSESYSFFNSPLQPLRGYHTDSSRSNSGQDTSR
ncbi:hypothetical protein BDQ17DRAFT_1421079 [Cyathus striatus]|nr:hypothetical protein BDQ17DRAFT_1421079 [Cyathus striatus]